MDAQEKKLRQSILITIIVGLVLTILLAVGLVTQVVNKQRAEIVKVKADYATQKQKADQLPEALKSQQKAEDIQQYVNGQLDFFRQRYRSLPFAPVVPAQITTAGLAEDQKVTQAKNNQQVVWRTWMNEYANGYGPALQRELIDAATETGVELRTTVKVGDPPRVPEECIPPTNGLFRPTGAPLGMSISGDLRNIMQFFNRINNSSVLLLVNNDLKLTGYSPDLTATFTMTPYLLASGTGAPITAAAAAAAPVAGASTVEGGSGSAIPAASGSAGNSSSP